MWLCRFVFCGKANEPTLNHITMASHLASGNRLPPWKISPGQCIPYAPPNCHPNVY
jgi:hypothetical protein